MIPGRTLQLSSRAIKISQQGLEGISLRSFSASTGFNRTSRTAAHPFQSGALGSKKYIRPQIFETSSILRNCSAIRFKSTNEPFIPEATSSPIALKGAETSNLPEWTSKASDVNIDNAVDLSSINILDLPEKIGYLKELGLDYGWGPTAICEFFLEHIHVWSGMPWWASIIATSLAFRIIFFKLFQDASDNSSRMASVQHLTKPLQEKSKIAARANDTAAVMRIRNEMKIITNRAGIRLWKSMTPLVSIFTGYGTFVILRAMSNLPVPGLEEGGVLWFQNLAIADPTYLLPICTAAMLHIALRKGGENGVNTMQQSTMKTLSYVFPLFSLIFTSWLPASVQLSFLTTSAFAYFQGAIFRSPSYRERMGMYPLPTIQNSSEKSPYQSRVITIEPNAQGTWEAPSADGKPTSVSQPTILSGLKKNVTNVVSAAKRKHQSTVKTAEEYLGRRPAAGETMTKKELQKVAKYEGMRRVQEAQRRAALDRDRVRRKRARKAENDE